MIITQFYMNIIIKGAISNSPDLTNQKFLEYLNQESNEFEYYTLEPLRGTGKITSACFDLAILGNISSVLSILVIILNFCKIYFKNKDSNQGVVIHIENSGDHNQFFIGNKSNEEVLKEVKMLLEEKELQDVSTELEVIKNNPIWKQIK